MPTANDLQTAGNASARSALPAPAHTLNPNDKPVTVQPSYKYSDQIRVLICPAKDVHEGVVPGPDPELSLSHCADFDVPPHPGAVATASQVPQTPDSTRILRPVILKYQGTSQFPSPLKKRRKLSDGEHPYTFELQAKAAAPKGREVPYLQLHWLLLALERDGLDAKNRGRRRRYRNLRMSRSLGYKGLRAHWTWRRRRRHPRWERKGRGLLPCCRTSTAESSDAYTQLVMG